MAIIQVQSTADNGQGSLRAAIAAAKSGDVIQFAPNLANQTIRLTNGQIEISPGKSLTIDGSGAPNLTISGNNASRIFYVNSNQDFITNVTVKNLALSEGYTADQGGVILGDYKANIAVDNVKFTKNTADNGGGAIFTKWDTSLAVSNSQFDGNTATKGNDERGAGAIGFVSPGNFTVSNSSFTNNKGINGGAINSLNGKLTIENSQFLNNSTTAARYDTGKANPTLRGYGGALYTDRASATNEASGSIRIVNSRFEGNQGLGEGGGAYLYTGTQDSVDIETTSFNNNQLRGLPQGNDGNGGGLVVISNGQNRGLTLNRTSFVNNSATNQGGGLWMFDAPATITNSTFSGNKALFSTVPNQNDTARDGGGLALYGAATITNSTIADNQAGWVGGGILASDAPVTVKNTIFARNTALNGGNPWNTGQQVSRQLTDGGGNIQDTSANNERVTPNARVIDPKLGALQDNGGGLLTYALQLGSPAINAGVAGAPSVDERGYSRDSQPDIGAIEFGAVSTGGQTSTPPVITSGTGSDTLTGGGTTTILAGAGNDTLTGSSGADRFVFQGATQLDAFARSRLNSMDRITNFDVTKGDRIVLDYDNNLSTVELPKGLFHAGKVTGKTLQAAIKAAYADKNQAQSGSQVLKANEAVLFRWGKGTYLSVNDNLRAFDSNRDLVINVTGLTMPSGQISAGVLPVNQYFA